MKNKILTGVLLAFCLVATIGWVMSAEHNDELSLVAHEQQDDIDKKSAEIANLKLVIVKKDDDLESHKVVIEEKDSQINKLEEHNKKILTRKDKLEDDVNTLVEKYNDSQQALEKEKAKKKVASDSGLLNTSTQKKSNSTASAKSEQQTVSTASSDAGGHQISVSATAYTAFCKGCSGITATGIDVRNTITYNGYRVIAVDPSVIPLHSIVKVSVGGQSFTAIALDTGGAIKGNKIDILVSSYSEAISFGRQQATVTILK